MNYTVAYTDTRRYQAIPNDAGLYKCFLGDGNYYKLNDDGDFPEILVVGSVAWGRLRPVDSVSIGFQSRAQTWHVGTKLYREAFGTRQVIESCGKYALLDTDNSVVTSGFWNSLNELFNGLQGERWEIIDE